MSYGFAHAEILVQRELKMQSALILRGETSPLNNPLLLGPVGIGKTAIARRAALSYDLPLLAINCGENSDATDVSGVPVPSMIRYLMSNGTASERKDAQMAYMEWVLNRSAALACTQPVFLLFDDLDKARPPVQGAMLNITANRKFRDSALHPGTLQMLAGNRLTDDIYANEISESIRTRTTIIEMFPDVVSFTKFGQESGDIHEAILGYLQFAPHHLHKHAENVARFPTPRGWWEASQQLFAFPAPDEDVFRNGTKDNWLGIISRKLGVAVGNDFWAWHTILQKVKVQEILRNGTLLLSGDTNEKRMQQYAGIFAVAQELNTNGVKPAYKGLENWIRQLDPEARIGLVIQIKMKVRTEIATLFPDVGDLMLADFVTMPDKSTMMIPGKKA